MRAARWLPLVVVVVPLLSASRRCPRRWLLFADDRCAAPFPVWASWSDAELLCSQSDSHLVSLRSRDDVEFVGKMAAKLGVPVWTGGYSVPQSESWSWSDGSYFSLNVCTNQMKNHSECLEAEGGEVRSAPCGEMRFYICSRHTSLEDDEEAGASPDFSAGSWVHKHFEMLQA
ncbi:oxidized low-density lipoprotein receptor 1-like [Boleophthalmus pectinirostris]|uniref:oxidized low-density lipoprotein receptor 1-like n=1 Tax=Boleophthalmus pectinirostris TaxID=150288 RepID=UPI00242BCAAF|nr:oxidized low-density lipoprotein receptor 1-like [Boleophthalmus pectinirostris]